MRRPLLLTLCLLACCSDREDTLRSAEKRAEEVAAANARFARGLGEALKAEGRSAAESVGQGLGEVAMGLGAGVDKSLGQVQVKVPPGLSSKLKITRASRSTDSSVSLYVVTSGPLQADLLLLALDPAGQEVGRASARLEEAAATGRYVDFRFDPRTPLLTAAGFELK